MPELQIRPRGGAAERCPYCHDCLEGGEVTDVEVVCERCGTVHHQACFAELGGCTVMGCPGGGAPPEGGLEEIREQIRSRVGRFVARNAKPPEAGVRERLAAHWACGDCGIAFFDRDCPFCEGVLEAGCEGSRRHCSDCDRAFVQSWGGVLLEPSEEERAKTRRGFLLFGLAVTASLVALAWAVLNL